MHKIRALLLIAFCMLSVNAMADAKLEINPEVSIANEANALKDYGVTVSKEAEQYPPALILKAVDAKGKVIPVETTIRKIPEGVNFRTEEIARVGLLLNDNQVVVVNDQLVNSKTEVHPFYYFIFTAVVFMLLAIALWYSATFTRSAIAFAVAAGFAIVFAVAAAFAVAFAVYAAVFTIVFTPVFATVFALAALAVFAAFVVDDGEDPNWRFMTSFFVLLTASAVCMYFGW